MTTPVIVEEVVWIHDDGAHYSRAVMVAARVRSGIAGGRITVPLEVL